MSDSSNNEQKHVETTMSPKQLIGAGVGILALIGLLIVGRTLSSGHEAELILGIPTPAVSEYQSDAISLDPFDAVGNEYDVGQLVTVETEIGDPIDEPYLGQSNVVVEMSDEVVESQGGGAVPVVLVFEQDELQQADGNGSLVMGRYIGIVELKGDLGKTKQAPAIQVDHVEAL